MCDCMRVVKALGRPGVVFARGRRKPGRAERGRRDGAAVNLTGGLAVGLIVGEEAVGRKREGRAGRDSFKSGGPSRQPLTCD